MAKPREMFASLIAASCAPRASYLALIIRSTPAAARALNRAGRQRPGRWW